MVGDWREGDSTGDCLTISRVALLFNLKNGDTSRCERYPLPLLPLSHSHSHSVFLLHSSLRLLPLPLPASVNKSPATPFFILSPLFFAPTTKVNPIDLPASLFGRLFPWVVLI